MSKSYLNVGCGQKFHTGWTNVDMRSSSPHVQQANLLAGFPFADSQFDVVYHSQVLEHIPQERAAAFLRECLRVLRPGGVLRVVVPDLENLATEYLRHLHECRAGGSEVAEANYDWVMLEMFDQTVRNSSGGQMAAFLARPSIPNEDYVVGRIGYVARALIEESRKPTPVPLRQNRKPSIRKIAGIVWRRARGLIKKSEVVSDAERIGQFRLGGEIHMWMYDSFSLKRALLQAGFERTRVMTPFTSSIANWNEYELDVKDGMTFDPTSLFMEAMKPVTVAR